MIGAYGFIGSAIARALAAEGHAVRGLGRAAATGRRLVPRIGWIEGDLRRMTAPGDWRPALDGVECVVNAAGVLQDGMRDNVTAVHDTAVRALVAACVAQDVRRFVQVSAAGVSPDSPSAFFRSKARGDAAVRASRLDWVILRPGLVIGPGAYGGSALLRALAAVPLVQPMALGDAPVQTVALADVARAAVAAARGRVPPGTEADLVAPGPLPLRAVIAGLRQWLGVAPARRELRLPGWLLRAVALQADALGWLGWRSPIRSTALAALATGVRGDPGPWLRATGETLPGLAGTLDAMPATARERRSARCDLLMPFAVAALALFWLAVGLAGLRPWQGVPVPAAADPAMLPAAAAPVAATALGAAVLVRRWARPACLGMAALGLAHVALAGALAPQSWSGTCPSLAAFAPAIVLALVTAALLEER